MDLNYYFKELGKIPVLQQEKTNKLAKIAKTNMRTRNTLVAGNLRYVIAVAKGFYGQGLSMADLIAEGNVGLITAVNKFKPQKDENFMKCAGWWIRQAMLFAISNNKVIRKPMNKIQEYKETNGVYEREKLTALDTPLDRESDSGSTVGDLIAAEIDERADNLEERACIIREATKCLEPTHRDIVFKKYGIGIPFPMTSFSISKEYGIAVASVDVILRKSIAKMHNTLIKLNIKYEM